MCGPKNGIKCKPEIVRFMKKHLKNCNCISNLVLLVNEHFETAFTYDQIKLALKTYGLKSGRWTQGNILPIGTETVDKEKGHIMIKVSSKGKYGQRWKRKHHIVWENANGKIPKGRVILFLDGNPLNCRIENLAMVTQAERLKLIQFGLLFDDKELTKTGIAIVKHNLSIHKSIEKSLGHEGHQLFNNRRTRERRKTAKKAMEAT